MRRDDGGGRRRPAAEDRFGAIVAALARDDPRWARRCSSLPRRHRWSRLSLAALAALGATSGWAASAAALRTHRDDTG